MQKLHPNVSSGESEGKERQPSRATSRVLDLRNLFSKISGKRNLNASVYTY